MATYTCTINGVDRAETHVLLAGFTIREVINGINTLTCEVESSDASLRPQKRQTIVVQEDGATIFSGVIKSARERGFGQPADDIDDIVTMIEADDHSELLSRRFVWSTFPSQSLKQTVMDIQAIYLDTPTFGVTVDAGMADGPTFDALQFRVQRIDEVFNFLAALSAKYGVPFNWKMSYTKVIGFYASSVAAPWNLVEGDGTEQGDIEVEPTDDHYANKIIVLGGPGTSVATSNTFTGDGVEDSFPLKYQILGPGIPTDQSPVSTEPVAMGFVYVDGVAESLGNVGAGYIWEYDATLNTITRTTGAPANGSTIFIEYDGEFKFVVSYEDAAEVAAHGTHEDRLLLPEIEDPDLALSRAEAEVARRIVPGQIVRFRSVREPAPKPGETLTITVPKRNITGSFTVLDVTAENEVNNANTLIRTFTCNKNVYDTWEQTVTRWWSEKDTNGDAQPAGSRAVPGPPPYSVQWNNFGRFGGAYHILYYDLFWDQPDAFTSPPEVRTKGLLFLTNGGIGNAGFVGVDDPQRLEMGMLGNGDFSMDLFGTATKAILINSTGSIFLTAGTPNGASPPNYGAVRLTGNPDPTDPVKIGVQTLPGDLGASYTQLNGLNSLHGVAVPYVTITALPFTINTTSPTNTLERTTFFVNSASGTLNLPALADFRSFPVTAVGRIYCIKNIHASGVVTVDPSGGETIDTVASLTLNPGGGVIIQREDAGWRVLATTGAVTLGGGGGATATSPGGNDKDVQFNDGGVFGGEDAFEWDKTENRLTTTTSGGRTSYRAKNTTSTESIFSVLVSDAADVDLACGRELEGGNDIARTTAPGYFWWENAGNSPSFDGIGMSVNPGEVAGDPMTYALERGFWIDHQGIAHLYQSGGLGDGAFTGCGLEIDRNDDDQGAGAYLSLQTKSGTRPYQWVDDDLVPRIGSAPPQEDGTPSDTSGYAIHHGGIIVKPSDESVANDTLQNDDHLLFAVEANTIYVVEVVLFITTGASNTPDIKLAWTMPASATITISQLMYQEATTGVTSLQIGHRYQNTTPSTAQPAGVLTSVTQPASSVIQKAVIRVGATAGTAQLQWAQNTSTGGTPTVVKADSYLRYDRVPA